MLDALYKLGKLYIEKEDLDSIDVLLDEKKIGAVVLIEFTEDSNLNFKYNQVFQEDYDSKNKVKYLYKKGSSRGTNITPSTLIGKALETTFNIKFLKWFENNKDNAILFNKLYSEISNNQDKIFNDLQEIVKNININDNILISIVINDGGINNYLNNYEEFKHILIEDSLKKYYGGKKNIKGNGACYLCNREEIVYGLVANAAGFKFSTIDKLGNVPDFKEKNQWKLLPICADCALYLDAGRKFVDKYLNFSEFGLRYYVIPSFLFDLEKGFDRLYREILLFESENLDSKDLVKIENKISRLTNKMDDVAEFKFLFYKTSNSAFDILSYVESVIPSWLNDLYKTQKRIADYDFFHEKNLSLIFGKNHEGNFLNVVNNYQKNFPCSDDNWYKRFLKDFLFQNHNPRTSQKPKNIDKSYLDLVSKIIGKTKIDYNFLLSKFMNEIRKQWVNKNFYSCNVFVLESLMLKLLLNDLNLIKGDKLMKNNEELNIELILNSPSKKATFLLGVLTRELIQKQYHNLDSSPFYNKLWGLSLDHKKIKKLYPVLINKLREYNIHYFTGYEELISKNLVLSEDNWNLSTDETSYYFVLGYTLYKVYENENNEGDSNE